MPTITTDRFRVGDVVQHLTDMTRVGPARPVRGQVMKLGTGVGNWDDEPGYRIRLAAGIYRIGSAYDEWTVVPPDQWTALERVRARDLRWTRPDWIDEGEPEHEPDTYAFAVIRGLLSPATDAAIFDDAAADWPMSILELVELVAADVDDRIAGARQLGAAMARLGA